MKNHPKKKPADAHPHQPHHARIRLIKKLLRPLPRKSNIHRYPILKWFAETARKRSYLWSFRVPEVVPALYAGSIITFMPLQGIQMPLALGAALLLRANLPILVALQFASNAFTLVPLYFADYYVGDYVLSFFDTFGAEVATEEVAEIAQETNWRDMLSVKKGLHIALSSMIGGAIIGYCVGLILSLGYRYLAWRGRMSHQLNKQSHPRVHSKEKSKNKKDVSL
jgi:uncharacterized protein